MTKYDPSLLREPAPTLSVDQEEELRRLIQAEAIESVNRWLRQLQQKYDRERDKGQR